MSTGNARRARLAGAAVVALMTCVIAWAALMGDFFAEGSTLTAMPWGVTTLVDLYAGLGLFAAWVLFVEGPGLRLAAWVLALVCLGNLAAGAYVLYRSSRAGADWQRFFMGERHG